MLLKKQTKHILMEARVENVSCVVERVRTLLAESRGRGQRPEARGPEAPHGGVYWSSVKRSWYLNYKDEAGVYHRNRKRGSGK